MGRQKLTHSMNVTCPYCKNRMKAKVNLEVGFHFDKLCDNPECRCKFNVGIVSIGDEGISYNNTFVGVQMQDRIPWKGMISAQKSKISGAMVVLYRASEANLPRSRNNEEFVMVCTKHDTGNLLFRDSYKEVLQYQGKPHLWCDGCKKERGIK